VTTCKKNGKQQNIKTDYSIQVSEEDNFGKTTEEIAWNHNRSHDLIYEMMMISSVNNYFITQTIREN
jgi:hypothetical protein